MYPRSQASRVWSWKANPGSWPKSELLTIRLCWLCFSRLYLSLEGHHHRRQSQLMTASSQAGPLVNRTENPPEQSSLGSWSHSLRIRRDQGPSQGGGPHCRGALGEDFGMGVARAITTVSRLSCICLSWNPLLSYLAAPRSVTRQAFIMNSNTLKYSASTLLSTSYWKHTQKVMLSMASLLPEPARRPQLRTTGKIEP